MAKRQIVTRVSNCVLYDDGLLRVDNVRGSYPHLDRAYAVEEGDKPAFSITGLLPKDTHRAAKDLIKKRIEEIIAENKAKVPNDKWFLTDGDKTEKPEKQGHFAISARESRRPSVRGADKAILSTDEIVETIYGGCYVTMLIRPWFQNHKKFGKRVNAGLVAVQFVKDGESFSENRISDDDVDDMLDGVDASNDGGGMDDDEDM
jgi:hypothetical protein